MKTHRITASALREEQSGRLNNSTIAVARGILTAAVALTLWIGATNPAHAQTLTGSGDHIPLGGPFPAVVYPTYVDNLDGTFTGTWSSPAQPNWLGTFTLSGPLPGGGVPTGSSTFDFSTLPLGFLPANSYFYLGDLDNGSGEESFTLKAYDATGVITTPWLNSPAIGQQGTGSGPGGTPALEDMPGWDWNSTVADGYYFYGSTVLGNPAIALALGNNQNIRSLDVSRDSNFTALYLGAPESVPEPSTWALLAGGFGALSFFMRRRSGTAD